MEEHTVTRPSKQVIHLRLDRELHQDVIEWAARTHRTISGALTLLLERGIEAEPSFPLRERKECEQR